MIETFNIMLQYFAQTKLAGSYFLLFLVSIVLLYYINKEKNIWFIMYGIVLHVVVIMNPVVVWVLAQIFPVLNSYAPLTMLVPILFYIPFAATELTDILKERKVRHVVVFILVFLIFICGNMCGYIKDYSVTENNISDTEELAIVDYLNAKKPNMILADESIIQTITARGNALPLFYGRDLWTADMDTGIMDGYNEEAYTLFDVMKNSELNADFIADTAYEYRCDIIIMDYFDEAPERLGKYKLEKTTFNYLVYALN